MFSQHGLPPPALSKENHHVILQTLVDMALNTTMLLQELESADITSVAKTRGNMHTTPCRSPGQMGNPHRIVESQVFPSLRLLPSLAQASGSSKDKSPHRNHTTHAHLHSKTVWNSAQIFVRFATKAARPARVGPSLPRWDLLSPLCLLGVPRSPGTPSPPAYDASSSDALWRQYPTNLSILSRKGWED
ncbi:hypothetical protein MPH_09152 [Macrophomina phaseolina MS6]|uniref:Uncharacterized protein n=1 Tax=Macrophomina phaseolina (strain MS6) TaxID=1126212 RepID=K2QVG3_MACPH|nr:hypothetical protein MPH_09152 [Macrophomina phaseolina MS6]